LVFSVLDVNSPLLHEEIQRDNISLCSAKMAKLWTRERDGGLKSARYAGHKLMSEIRGTTCLIGFRGPRMSVIALQIATCTCCMGDGNINSHIKLS